MNIPKPNVLGSLVVENQQTASDRDAAAVLDPDTFVHGMQLSFIIAAAALLAAALISLRIRTPQHV